MAKNWKKEYEQCEERCRNMPELPDGFGRWCESLFEDLKWMVYKKHGAYADLFCCECGREETVKIKRGQSYEAQMAEHVFDMPARNEVGECPWCGKKVRFKAGVRTNHEEKKIAWIGQRYQDRSYVLRYFIVMEEYGQKEKARYDAIELARIFFLEGKRTIKKDYYLYNSFDGVNRWCPHNVGGLGNIILKSGQIYPVTYKNMEGTAVEYSMAREYAYSRYDHPAYRYGEWEWNIGYYMQQYWMYPVLEMLVKQKAKRLTDAVARNSENHLMLDKRAKKPWDMLGVRKDRLKDLVQKDSKVTWKWYRYEKEKGIKLKDDLIEWYQSWGITPRMLNEVIDVVPMSLQQIKNYLEKQEEVTDGGCKGSQAPTVANLLRTWEDYLTMAKEQGHDTKDAIVYRPKDLEQAHARVVAASARNDAKSEAEKYYKKYPEIKETMQKAKGRYSYSNSRYCMIIPEQIEDVLIEGRTLHHCISASDRYIGRMAAGETYIGFVRSTERPDVPFYSVEFEPGGTVRQKRTYYNRHDEHLNDVVEFLREWQEWVRKTMTPEEKRKAKVSERRRLEDMEEFYKNDPKFAKLTEEDLLVNSNVPPQIMLDVSRYILGAGRTRNSEAGQQALAPAM